MNVSDMKIMKEDTTGPMPDNMTPADFNVSANTLFQQSYISSLPRQIFAVVDTIFPTGSLFAFSQNKTTKLLEVKKRALEVFPSEPIKTSITKELVEDLRNVFGKESGTIITKMLTGFVNDDENEKCLSFLDANSATYPNITISDSANSEVVIFELTKYVQEIVIKMNMERQRTFNAFVVLPYKSAAAIMALSEYAGGDSEEQPGLYIGSVGMTKYFINPDATSNTCYVGLVDKNEPGRSSATFSPYVREVFWSQDDVFSNDMMFISNRYAITLSPLHETGKEMLYKFDIL